MENTELLQQILAAIEQNNDSLRREIREGQAALRKDIIDQVADAMNTQSQMLTRMVDRRVTEAETRINIKIEHEIDHQLKALFDGYKLNHDKIKELDKRAEKLDSRVERLEIRMDVPEEHRTA